MQNFFFDNQIRRFLLQFTRIFSNFQVMYGAQGSDGETLVRVPVRYGDWSRQAQTVAQENSSSFTPSAPLITFYITGMEYQQDRMQDPYHVNKVHVRQRRWDSATSTYETTQGNAFTVERLMPVPYRMTLTTDIWTANTNQKFQLFEQIATLFNPALEIQSTDNYLDWTSLSVVELENVNWSSRSVPAGTENPIDIMSMRFGIPIWLTGPARVKKLGVIERVMMNIYDAGGDLNEAITNNDLLLGNRIEVSPWNYKIIVINNRIQILPQDQVANNGSLDDLDPTDLVSESPLEWTGVLESYGAFRPGISQIRLQRAPGSEDQIVGTIVLDPTDNRLVIFTPDPDTMPQNSLPAIDAIIDPLVSAPGLGLPAPVTGTRYLLTQSTGNWVNPVNPQAWLGLGGQPLVALANDIIEWDGARWRVTFVSQEESTQQYVTNITTGVQYEWTGDMWKKSYQGIYLGGQWSLVI